MRLVLSAVIPALLLASGGAARQSEPVAAPSPKPKKEARLCRATQETGSRIGGGKVCHTASQWAAIDADAASSGESVRGSHPH